MSVRSFRARRATDPRRPRWRVYAELVVGKCDLSSLIRYELITILLSDLGGALGLYLRGKLYPRLFGSVGQNPIFGRRLTLRHPHKIHLGDNVILDDNVVLDAKGPDTSSITIADNVFVGRNSILCCKAGSIDVLSEVTISSNCEVFSSERVTIGRGTMVAAYCYIMSGGNYDVASATLFSDQDAASRGATVIGENCWLGAHVTVLDGVTIGTGSVIAPGAVIRRDLPEMTLAGVPQRLVLVPRAVDPRSAAETREPARP